MILLLLLAGAGLYRFRSIDDEIFRARDAENSLIPSVFRRLVRPFHQY